QRGEHGRSLRVEVGRPLPFLRMDGLSRVVEGQAGRGEDFGEGAAAMLVAGTPPGLLLGGGEQRRDLVDVIGGHAPGGYQLLDDAPPATAIDILPWREGAAPVEDHGVHGHGIQRRLTARRPRTVDRATMAACRQPPPGPPRRRPARTRAGPWPSRSPMRCALAGGGNSWRSECTASSHTVTTPTAVESS